MCSIHARDAFLARLRACLAPQLTDEVELLIETDAGELSIGAKRNRLVLRAQGKYVAFIDDDDLVSDDYVARILEAAKQDSDAIGFRVKRLVNGIQVGEAVHSLENTRYEQRTLADGSRLYLRPPNHLNPIRRSIAFQVPFMPANFGEDRDYAERVRPLLKSEHFIDAQLYMYLYRTPALRAEQPPLSSPTPARLPANLLAIHTRRARQQRRGKLREPVDDSRRLAE